MALELATATEKLASLRTDSQRLADEASRLDVDLRKKSELLQSESATRSAAEERASRVPMLETQVREIESDRARLRERNAQLASELEYERKQIDEKLALLAGAKDALSDQFRNLANQIFEDKGAKFVQQNKDSLNVLLAPLDQQIKDFKAKVEDVYVNESKERFSLQGEIKRLLELNTRLSDDAVNLTNALKGESKTQGNWGEMILERVLEGSGLQKGREYEVQVSLRKDDGKGAQPDVVVYLPEGKHIVIDSKVSLKDYEQFSAAETDADREMFRKAHIESVRRHVSMLSQQNYQSLYGLKSLDFVLMFLPIEPAFRLAVETDRDLFFDAFQKNIMMVGPSTLLISLKTIASIWRYEHQNRSAQDLARHCASLYDKFVGFVGDLEDVGKRIDAARVAYDAAHGKLSAGKGNLVRQVERIRALGVKPGKALPPTLLEISGAEMQQEIEENPQLEDKR